MSYYNYDNLNWENPDSENFLYWAYLIEAFNERMFNNIHVSQNKISPSLIRFFNLNLANIKTLCRSSFYRNIIISNIINLGFIFTNKEKILNENLYDPKYAFFLETPFFTLDEMRDKINYENLGKPITDWNIALKNVKNLLQYFRYKLYTSYEYASLGESGYQASNVKSIDKYTFNVYPATIQGVLQNPEFLITSYSCNNILRRECRWLIENFRYYIKDENGNDVIQYQNIERMYLTIIFKACCINQCFSLPCNVEYYIFPYHYLNTGQMMKNYHYYFKPFKKDGKLIWKVGEDNIPKNIIKRFEYKDLSYNDEPFTNDISSTEFFTDYSYQITQSILCGIYDFYDSFVFK